MADNPVTGNSSDPNIPAITGTGLTGVKGVGLAGIGIGVLGVPQTTDPLPTNFIGVKGDGGTGLAPGGIPIGVRFGVVGTVSTPAGSGVQGSNSQNVGVEGQGRRGVVGEGQDVGVQGFCDAGAGVEGNTKTGTAVHGQSSGPGIGVFGQSAGNDAVQGLTSDDHHSGVAGLNDGAGTGVFGRSLHGTGVLGRGSPAGHFDGDVEVVGNISVTGDVLLANKDLAERFEVNATAHYDAGMLMIVGRDGTLEPCSLAYDKRAIGVISGAGTLRAAITLGSAQSHSATVPIALVGTAFCLVDADLGSVETGDLLTSSQTPGHAMRAKDHMKSLGAIVGKALAPLLEGRRLVPIIISLQ